MNYRKEIGGITGAIEERVKSLREEGFGVDIISTHGYSSERCKNIIRIFKETPNYDFLIAVGCADYGFLPILVGLIAAKIHKKKILVDFHAGYPVPFMNRFGRFFKMLLGDIPVTVASKYLYDIFMSYNFRVYLISYNFHYGDFPEPKIPFSWNKKFMWAALFQFMYDPETALKACELVLKQRCDVEFHFFGEGPLLEKMRKKYKHPNIKFNGLLPRSEFLKRYQDYSVFINTSFGDNFPMRLVEASFYSLLVISAKYGGTPTIYTEKECLFFERGDYKRLSKYIVDICENPKLYDSFRINMHEKITTFTWNKIRDIWLELLKN
jgi:glycosyltransferase involved in cell wall biosynthesis